MIRPSIARRLALASLMAAALAVSPCSRAITILSGPTFTPATNAPLNAPLAGVLKLTTDVDSRISVLVSDGTDTWERDFYDFSTTHSVPLLGFKPGRTNRILVAAYDKARNACTASHLLTFVTAPLPADFPVWTVLKSEPDRMEPGYTLFLIRSDHIGYITMMDASGQVVWYSPAPAPTSELDVRQLDNGDLFVEEQPPQSDFLEINMLGEIVRTLPSPPGYPVNPHEGIVTDHGTVLYLSDVSRSVSNFPSSDTVPNPPLKTVTVDDNPVVEISLTNLAVLHTWSPLDLLDPTRVTYLTYGEDSGSPHGTDNEHANAIIDDTNDNSLIVSLRNQNAVFDFSRSGQLKWILGPHALWGTNFQQYLLTPVGTPFDWNYGQHAPELTPQGTLILYDDGNYRASPFDPSVADPDNYSSAVEYKINETNKTVSEVWNSAWQTNQDRLYTPVVGKAQWLPKRRNVLVTYGLITYVNGVHPNPNAPNAFTARIVEYTHDPVPKVVFDVDFGDHTNPNFAGDLCYRSRRIPDLYPHPAEPVTDLAVSDQNQIPLLEFSADPAHRYLIQASTDLTNWTTIGTPVQEGNVGDFDFDDLNASQFKTRFYRVVTQ